MNDVKVGNAARVVKGEYVGMVGMVEQVERDGEHVMAMVRISGVRDGEAFDVREWFDVADMEVTK